MNDDFEPEDDFVPDAPASAPAPAAPVAPSVSQNRARAMGGLAGATLDFDDELGAGVQALGAAITPGMSASETYREALRDNRQEKRAAADQQPWDYAGAKVAGTVLSPVNKLLAPLGAAKGMAALGAAYGLGESEAKDLVPQIEDTVTGGLGGMAGGALASRFPTLTGAAATGAGLALNDPEMALGGAMTGASGALARGLEYPGAALQKPGQATRTKIAERLVKGENRDVVRSFKDRFKLLRGSTEPVGGPRAVGPKGEELPDIDAQAWGLVGPEVDAAGRAMEQHGRLGFKLTPDAEAGRDAAMPDLVDKYIGNLSKLKGGKQARFEELKARLLADREAAVMAGRPPDGSPPATPDWVQPSFDPTLLESNTLRPNPVPDFDPKYVPSGFVPKTAADLAGSPKVGAALDAMKAQQGPASRLASGAFKGATNPITGTAAAGSLGFGSPAAAGGVAGVGGLYGAGKALVTDPVLATSVLEPVGRVLSKGGNAVGRWASFLGGVEGPALAAKIQFLMKADAEFRKAVEAEAQNGQ